MNRAQFLRRLMAAAVFPAACASVSGRGKDVQAPAQSHRELAAAMQTALDAQKAKHGFPGASAAILLPDGSMLEAATGFADVEKSIAMKPGHRMPMGSIGKTFIAAAILALVQDGVLRLDDKVHTYLGDRPWYPTWPNADAITVRMLLNHSTGAPYDYIDRPDLLAKLKQTIDERTTLAALGVTHDDYAAALSGAAAEFLAGEGFHYTDVNYVLAAMVAETAAGASIEAQVRKGFLKPFQLSSIEAQRKTMAGVAPGYLPEAVAQQFGGLPLKSANDDGFVYDPEFEWGGGGYVGVAGDLARWGKLYFSGAAMKGSYLAEMHASRRAEAVDALGAEYGLALQFIKDPKFGDRLFHGGYMLGYIAKTEYLPRYDLAVSLMINTVDLAYAEIHQSLLDLAVAAVAS